LLGKHKLSAVNIMSTSRRSKSYIEELTRVVTTKETACNTYLEKRANFLIATACCMAGNSSNSEAVYDFPVKSSSGSNTPIRLQTDSAVAYKHKHT
jgi:hypothetical protein